MPSIGDPPSSPTATTQPSVSEKQKEKHSIPRSCWALTRVEVFTIMIMMYTLIASLHHFH